MSRPDFARAAAAGILAGLAAGAVMNGFQAAWASARGDDGDDDGDPATTKAADRLAVAVTGAPVPDRLRGAADPAVHYATSAVLGLAYAVAAEAGWPVTAGAGTAFGFGTAAVLDETLVPALGLAPSPTATPAATHLYALASHLVFGVALEGARLGLRGR